MTDETTTADGGSTRRTVLRTAAWTAPAAIVAVAAPAFATSPGNDIKNSVYRPDSGGYSRRIDEIYVTNDGPDVLAANTVTMTVTMTSGIMEGFPTTAGSWTVISRGGGGATFGYTARSHRRPVQLIGVESQTSTQVPAFTVTFAYVGS